MASIMIGTITVPLVGYECNYKDVEELIEVETQERVYINPKPISARKRNLCFCDDDEDGHYHCHFCDCECDSKNHLEEHERDICEDAYSVRAFGYKLVPRIEIKKIIKTVPCIATEIMQPMVVVAPRSNVCETAVQTKIANNIVTKDMMAKSGPSSKQVSRALVLAGKKEIGSYNLAIKKMDEAMQQNSALQRRLFVQQHSTIKQQRKGAVQLRLCSYEQAEKRAELARKRQEEEEAFLQGSYDQKEYIGKVLEPISTQRGRSVGFRSPYWHRSFKKPARIPTKKKVGSPTRVLREVLSVVRNNGVTVEFIGRKTKRLTARYVSKGNSMIPKVTLPHESGKYKRKELDINIYSQCLAALCAHGTYRCLNDAEIRPGDSGLVFDKRSPFTFDHTQQPFMIIRGRLNGRLVNALDEQQDIHSIHHY
nr:P1 protein [Bean common mosaic virus]